MPDKEPTGPRATLPPDVRTPKGVFAKAIGAFVPKVTTAVFQKFGFHSAEIMSAWGTIVGAELARLTRPESIKWPRGGQALVDDDEGGRSAGATLLVATDPAFALEVSYRQSEIIDRINRYFGYRAVAQIKIHQMPWIEDRQAQPERQQPAASAERAPVASGDLTAALDALGRSVAAAHVR